MNAHPHRAIPVVIMCCLAASSSAFAWSNKEHMQLTRIAAERLIADPKTPADMKAWLRRGVLQPLDMQAEREWFLKERIGLIVRTTDPLPYWATMPDMVALTDQDYKKQEPWGVHERLLHYIDLEYFMPDETKRTYIHDLSHKPKLENIPD